MKIRGLTAWRLDWREYEMMEAILGFGCYIIGTNSNTQKFWCSDSCIREGVLHTRTFSRNVRVLHTFLPFFTGSCRLLDPEQRPSANRQKPIKRSNACPKNTLPLQ